MKLTGQLKKDVEHAENKEQAKEMIANAGMELTDEEMSMVSGGAEDEGIKWKAPQLSDCAIWKNYNPRSGEDKIESPYSKEPEMTQFPPDYAPEKFYSG